MERGGRVRGEVGEVITHLFLEIIGEAIQLSRRRIGSGLGRMVSFTCAGVGRRAAESVIGALIEAVGRGPKAEEGPAKKLLVPGAGIRLRRPDW